MRTTTLSRALTPLQSLIARRWRPHWICQECRRPPLYQRAFSTTSARREDKPYYVTTPIFYVNAAPHVGHMYTMILADVMKRWQQLQGRKAILLTGTDEHGMKIQRAAAKAGVEPKEFCDKGAEVFKDLAARVGMSNDIFIRTTDRTHKEGVEYAWQMLEERGYIYESKHEGWYSVSDETFFPPSQVQLIVDPPTGRKIHVSIETGKEVEWTSERNYHFRMSAFREKLLDFYASNPDYIIPKSRMDEVVAQVTAGLDDLSISRPTFRLTWGIPVPSDPTQTIYVWLDALLNYATAIGYPFTPGTESSQGWPPSLQIIGKDILRFHAIYFPAFLLSLALPPPPQLLTHAHWTLNHQKMAKSTGNGVDPFFALERFGVDALRYYLVREGGIVDDADYDNAHVIAAYKKGLQGGLGNLASRVLRGKGWDVRRAVSRCAHDEGTFPKDAGPASQSMAGRLRVLPEQVDAQMRALRPDHALKALMKSVHDCNGYVQAAAPWDLAKRVVAQPFSPIDLQIDPSDAQQQRAAALVAELDSTIFLCAETLRLVGIQLQAFVPGAAGRLLDMLGVEEGRRGWAWCVFGRDGGYGTSFVELGRGERGVLFPGLTSDF